MATSDNTTQEKKMSKDVQLILYLNAGADTDKRMMMQNLDDSWDYGAIREKEISHYTLIDGDWYSEIDEDEYERLKHSLDGNVTAHEFVENREEHKHGGYDFSKGLARDILRDVNTAPESQGVESTFTQRAKKDGETVFRVRNSNPELKPMLEKKGENNDEVSWPDNGPEYWTVGLTLSVNKVKPSLYRHYDDNAIPNAILQATSHDAVDKVRVFDCEREYSESGVCHDI